jgi:NADH:ubiquinone oxidoreductase subunit 5 (subunit L)/multisubunit Na+/H+ antiporter MnhA subunit
VSHAWFKSLLFVGTGAVLHATGERSLGKLGGLIRYMPWVAWLTLIGVLASAGLPPLGGFVSEWLLLQSFLFTPGLPSSFLNMLVPLVAAVIALVAALSGYTMVKFYGVVFLGEPREEKAFASARRRKLGAHRHAVAGRRLRRARAVPDPAHRADRPGDTPVTHQLNWCRPAWAKRSRSAAGCSCRSASSGRATAR